MPVNIHGKQYVTVAERVTEAGKSFLGLDTEVLQHTPLVVIKATVKTDKGTFTGISAANPSKAIEKASPYEVAETSAVGRALGFAGFGSVEGIATADEMVKADPTDSWKQESEVANAKLPLLGKCVKCGAANTISKTTGKIYCSKFCWNNK